MIHENFLFFRELVFQDTPIELAKKLTEDLVRGVEIALALALKEEPRANKVIISSYKRLIKQTEEVWQTQLPQLRGKNNITQGMEVCPVTGRLISDVF